MIPGSVPAAVGTGPGLNYLPRSARYAALRLGRRDQHTDTPMTMHSIMPIRVH
jgi:hypothetical protein